MKGIKNRHGATLNDIVLAVVAGALRRFLRRRGEQVEDLTFRAMVPVNVRTAADHGRLGNRVSFMVAPLPLGERDPGAAPAPVVETMQVAKQLEAAPRRRGPRGGQRPRVQRPVRAGRPTRRAHALPYNMVVTNVPGPQFPVYMLGAPLREVYPLVPLFSNQGLGIALFSYDGGLFWGFNADWDAVPDLHDVVGDVEAECATLSQMAASGPAGLAVRQGAGRAAGGGQCARHASAARRRADELSITRSGAAHAPDGRDHRRPFFRTPPADSHERRRNAAMATCVSSGRSNCGT